MTADVKITLRLPRELHTALAEAISHNRRSLNTEIVTRLESSFKDGAGQAGFVDQASELEALRAQVRALESRVPFDLVERLAKVDDLLRDLDGKTVIAVENGSD